MQILDDNHHRLLVAQGPQGIQNAVEQTPVRGSRLAVIGEVGGRFQYDRDALITVGMLPFTSSPGQPSIGFDPPGLADVLDLICVHVYPKPPPFEQALSVLEKFDTSGKPLVIEETFPLECEAKDMPAFIDATKKHADGWIGFYWGQTPEELRPSTRPIDVTTRGWLEAFRQMPRVQPTTTPGV